MSADIRNDVRYTGFVSDIDRAHRQRRQLTRCDYCGCAVTDPVHCDSCGAPVPFGGFVWTNLQTIAYSY